MSSQLSISYTTLSNYLTAWRLKVNDDKTHVMLLTTSQNRKRNNLTMTVRTGQTEQNTSEVEKLLGLQVHQDLKFREHLVTNTQSVTKMIRAKISAMKMLQGSCSRDQLLHLYHGLVGSRLSYLSSVWGGTENNILDALQKLQNQALRIVCRKGRYYQERLLLHETRTLSVRQMVDYFSILQARRVIETREPEYLYGRLVSNERVRPETRHAGLGDHPVSRITLVSSGWVRRVDRLWRELPRHLVNEPTYLSFKSKLRNHLSNNNIPNT